MERATTPQFPEMLARFKAQASRAQSFYGAPFVDDPEGMIWFLAQAAKAARQAAGRKLVHIAASLDADQSTIYRFEQGHWPRDPDRTLAAYADDLGIDVSELWADALTRWLKARQNDHPH